MKLSPETVDNSRSGLVCGTSPRFIDGKALVFVHSPSGTRSVTPMVQFILAQGTRQGRD